MEHSSAYIDFKKQLKETGKQKLDGYYPDLLYCINADERKEIEKDIWTYFVKKDDAGLAIFMPYLEDYDGIGALKKKLSAFKVPSSVSADIALALFDVTEDKQYLDIIMDNYRGLAVNTPIAARLARLAKKPGVYDLLVDIYLHDKDEANRVQAAVGILWRDGKLNSVNNPNEFTEKIDLIRAFKLDSEGNRTKQGK